jgi:RIP metalloprotease RseP
MAEFLKIVGSAVFLVFFFGFCIFIHELGHFLAAKLRGLHIIAFSLGFKKFWSRKINGVEYRLGYLPFGGYVELPQIDSTGTPKDENGNDLPEASPVDRIVTAVAGPLFNILFGLVLGCAVWIFGVPQDTPKMKAIIVDEISETGPEYQAGLRSGDKIVKLNGKTFYGTWSNFAKDVMLSVGEVTLEVEGAEKKLVSYTPGSGSPFAPEELRREKIAYPYFMPSVPFALFPEKDSIAEKAGIEKGDILLAVNGKKIAEFMDFQNELDAAEGKTVNLKLQRGDRTVEVKLTPELIRNSGATPYLIGIQWNLRKGDDSLDIGSLIPGYPAEAAGLKAGDIIRKVNGAPVTSRNELWQIAQQGKPVTLEVERAGKTFECKMTPKERKYYTIGVQMAVNNYPNPFRQLYDTVDLTYKSLRSIFYGLANKMGLTESGSTIGIRNLSGPLGIARVLFVSVYSGSFMHGIYFVVIITFALAIFNLLPLPVLDGGHCLIAALEIVFKRKMPDVVIRYISTLFVVLLVGLMVYVTFMDAYRLVPRKYLDSFKKTETKETSNVPKASDPAPESK